MKKKSILFLCTGNSCRSQMAEGFAKIILKNNYNIYSAGIKKTALNPYAIKVMNNVSIDISNHYSKTISELPTKNFDYVITVCDNAKESCPVFSGKTKMIHHNISDPPSLCENINDKKAKFAVYSRVRDEIKAYIENLEHVLIGDSNV